MPGELIECVSQSLCDAPYKFKVTGIRVFSFEEALYHSFAYWKQSSEDVFSDDFADWVNDGLGLKYLAARIKTLRGVKSFGERFASFLRLVDFFDADEIEGLQGDLSRWEKRRDWEKLKERADYLMERNEPDKAAAFYLRAAALEENHAIYNNLGVALMKTGEYERAYRYLKQAEALSDNDRDVRLNLAEAAAYSGRYDEAAGLISAAGEIAQGAAEIPFLRGLLALQKNEYSKSISYFENAVALSGGGDAYYIHCLSDVYAKMRQYEKALRTLESVANKDSAYYEKQAEIYASSGDVPSSVRATLKALVTDNQSAELWLKLAAYHRRDYDLQKANAAITRSLSIDPENERAKLERARIKKAMGRTREYQAALGDILKGFKERYRELNA